MVVRKAFEGYEKEILDFLFEGPKSISEIQAQIKSTWPTTNSYLEKLKEEGKVNELLVTDKMKIFRRTDDPVYFSLPFNKDIRGKTLFLLKQINETWKAEKGTDLSKTALQKIAVDVIKNQKLDLPILNFHYGMTTCASFDADNSSIRDLIQDPIDKEEIIQSIKIVISQPKHTGKANQEKINQYEKYKMDFYLAKEKTIKSFSTVIAQKSIPKDKEELKNHLTELSIKFPLNLEKFYAEFQSFISNSQAIISSDDKDNEKMEIVKETFCQLWDKLTTYTSFIDSARFIDLDKKQLFEQIKEINLNYKEMSYRVYSDELESKMKEINLLTLNMPQDSFSKEIQNLIMESLENE